LTYISIATSGEIEIQSKRFFTKMASKQINPTKEYEQCIKAR